MAEDDSATVGTRALGEVCSLGAGVEGVGARAEGGDGVNKDIMRGIEMTINFATGSEEPVGVDVAPFRLPQELAVSFLSQG